MGIPPLILVPGGRYFDPFGMAEGPKYATYKENEIKNGRLAMTAFLGFAAQHAATGKGPIENLVDVSNMSNIGFLEEGWLASFGNFHLLNL